MRHPPAASESRCQVVGVKRLPADADTENPSGSPAGTGAVGFQTRITDFADGSRRSVHMLFAPRCPDRIAAPGSLRRKNSIAGPRGARQKRLFVHGCPAPSAVPGKRSRARGLSFAPSVSFSERLNKGPGRRVAIRRKIACPTGGGQLSATVHLHCQTRTGPRQRNKEWGTVRRFRKSGTQGRKT